jgi:rubrerythrin
MQTVVDVLKLAIVSEIKAKTFYTKASEITSDGEAQMVFLELVEMEDGHARLLVDRFADLFAAAGFDARTFSEESAAAIEKSLGVEETELITAGDMRRVIDFAAGLEAQARDNYTELATRMENPDQRAICEDLAAEEQRHFETLSKLRVSVDTPIDERPAL